MANYYQGDFINLQKLIILESMFILFVLSSADVNKSKNINILGKDIKIAVYILCRSPPDIVTTSSKKINTTNIQKRLISSSEISFSLYHKTSQFPFIVSSKRNTLWLIRRMSF